MRKIFYILIVQAFFVSNIFSQIKTDTDLVKANTFYFEMDKNEPNGRGFDILKKEIKNSQFVILGEEHFSSQVSKFTNSIIPTLKQNKFNYFACEIGSNSANKISKIIEQEKSLYNFNTEINNLVGEIPIPFFDGKEDEVFLKSFIKSNFKIWGIDQEYLTSQVFLIDRLYQLSNKSKKIEQAYLKVKKFVISETKKSRKDRKYKVFTVLLNSPKINLFFGLLDKNSIEINKIIYDLKKSWEVYKLREDKKLHESFRKRLKIMQENFINYYNTALKTESVPKVFLKIGGVHASKGKSHQNIYDIGNFMMELANFNKKKSVHILIFPSGHLNNKGLITKNIDKEDEQLFNGVIDSKSNKWTLIDLKSIEKLSWKHKIKHKSLKNYMYRFDYLILTPASKQTEINYEK